MSENQDRVHISYGNAADYARSGKVEQEDDNKEKRPRKKSNPREQIRRILRRLDPEVHTTLVAKMESLTDVERELYVQQLEIDCLRDDLKKAKRDLHNLETGTLVMAGWLILFLILECFGLW